MSLRHLGFIGYLMINVVYLLLFYSGYAVRIQPYGGWIPLAFSALGLYSAIRPAAASMSAEYRPWRVFTAIWSIAYAVLGLLFLAGVLQAHGLLFWNGLSLIWLLPEWRYLAQASAGSALTRRLRAPLRWAASAVSVAVLLFSIPLPSMQALAVDRPAAYQTDDAEGKLLAPQIAERRAYLLDWLQGKASRGVIAEYDVAPEIDTEFSEAELQALAEFNSLPFDIPPGFYSQFDDALTNPHTLARLLGAWNEHSGDDITQGENVMGIGVVDAEGRIYAAGDITALTEAAAAVNPDVFIVPVDVFNDVKRIAPELLVIPVTHFEEVLFVLDQPVAFWPISSFGLFCH